MVKVNPARASKPSDRSPRVKAALPVHAAGGIKGFTKDISATGVFLEFDSSQEPGNRMSFWIELNTAGGKMKLVCEAEVVRVEQEDGKTRVGTKIIKQELLALKE